MQAQAALTTPGSAFAAGLATAALALGVLWAGSQFAAGALATITAAGLGALLLAPPGARWGLFPAAPPLSLRSAGAAAGSPRERFRSLLAGAGLRADELVLAVIARSAGLSYRMLVAGTVEEAVALYKAAEATPRTTTRLHLREAGIIVDGDLAVPGAQTALFFHALKHEVPRVLKVPAGGSECALFADVAPRAPPDVFLVPVERLEFFHGAQQQQVLGAPGERCSDVSPLLRAGILMPAYAGTLLCLPAPMSAAYALKVLARLAPTLRFLHASGWLHGDVKPGNIFLDYSGCAWLGDYGSSVRLAEAARYTGGTPAYQCADIDPAAAPLRFDLAGLARHPAAAGGRAQTGGRWAPRVAHGSAAGCAGAGAERAAARGAGGTAARVSSSVQCTSTSTVLHLSASSLSAL
jgi:hypothetical protein